MLRTGPGNLTQDHIHQWSGFMTPPGFAVRAMQHPPSPSGPCYLEPVPCCSAKGVGRENKMEEREEKKSKKRNKGGEKKKEK